MFKVSVKYGDKTEEYVVGDPYKLADKYVELLRDGVELDCISTSEGEEEK